VSRKKLVILGASITGLGVVRDAMANGLEPLLVDVSDGIAFRSSLARRILCDGDEQVLKTLLAHEICAGSLLIATSDSWIEFVMLNRTALDDAYDTVLHASNDVLEICTDKFMFARWCLDNQVSAPRFYEIEEGGIPADCDLTYPLLLRPYKGVMNGGGGEVPKAVHVSERAALLRWVKAFRDAKIHPIATQSLLGTDLVQYSVGLARNGALTVSFVAEKVRPHAGQCAVGCYVVLRENAEVEALARDVAERLGYFGIAEFEILHVRESGENYLIEINARPWIQYGLGPKSGHNLLKVLLDAGNYDASNEKKTGVRWLDFNDDLYNCFSRRVGLVRNGSVSWRDYVASVFRANAFSKWKFSDQAPFWYALRKTISDVGRRYL